MKIIHTADIHIGDGKEIEDYLGRHKGVLQQIIDYAVELKKTDDVVLVIAGDLFHRKKITSEERILADWWLGAINRNGIRSVMIAGNHDHLYGEVTNIDGYNHIDFDQISVVTWDPKVVTVGDCAFLCLPWHGYSEQEIKDSVELMLYQAKGAKYKVVVMHECIVGSRFDNGILAERGTNLPYIPGIDYWALGDIHTHQAAKLDNAWYSGSPLQFKFADRVDKGFIVKDLSTCGQEFVRTVFKQMRTVSSTDQITDDAYYYLRGDIGQVIEANNNVSIIRTDWTKMQQDVVQYPKLGITDGLSEFLAAKGCDTEMQQFAAEWIDGVIKEA